MYGSSGKLGRGGGGGGGGGRGGAGPKRTTRSSFHPSALNRPSPAAGRSSMAGGGAGLRNRAISPLVPAASTPTDTSIEETYSLITSNPLNFAMTIRLAPNLVEEIKRVEAQGGVTRIKFDGNTNNPLGNIICVGGKEFKFTWSPETGDLCDIYEERENGEDGTGLLVESGSAWRKLNVQRVLDESTKNQVKLRSEEAERKNKSRRAIVLDHRNPSTKSRFKALASNESNPSRNSKTKKEQPPPAKKRKFESVSGPPKFVHKSGSIEIASTKGRTPTSASVSQPEHSGAPTSPYGSVNISKGHANKEKCTHDMNKTTNFDKNIGRPLVSSINLQEKPGSITSSKINQPVDLRTMLISLLQESSLKGMSLKDLKKAVPNSKRQIKSTLRKIATFQAPDKYFLKSGVEIEGLKKPLLKRQSSPEDTLHPRVENEKECSQQDHSEPMLPITREDAGFLEKVDAPNADIFNAKKITTGNSEGPVVSSSDSGSENNSSDDSISLSDSDSDSDVSTNNQEMSDDEVDIIKTASTIKMPNVLQLDIPRPHQRASQSNGSYQPRVEMGGRDRDTSKDVHGIILPADLNDKKHKDPSLTGSNDNNQRKRESSYDESSCPFSKYEKDEPQLKGSIKDFSDYKEYVKEYKEKYDIYVSLDIALESSRKEFIKHQREIEAAVKKDPERYRKLARQIKESFSQSAERHKRLKRIFVVLYEESVNLKQKIKEFADPYLKN